ncbi:hypothetical protein HKBW3S42_01599, partial [Candidatus Hakubella thermalkaliphila]
MSAVEELRSTVMTASRICRLRCSNSLDIFSSAYPKAIVAFK